MVSHNVCIYIENVHIETISVICLDDESDLSCDCTKGKTVLPMKATAQGLIRFLGCCSFSSLFIPSILLILINIINITIAVPVIIGCIIYSSSSSSSSSSISISGYASDLCSERDVPSNPVD